MYIYNLTPSPLGGCRPCWYRGTSLIRNCPPPRTTIGPMQIPTVGFERGLFRMSEVPL